MWEECLCSTILCACVCVNDFPAAAAARNKNEKAKRDNEDYNKKNHWKQKNRHIVSAPRQSILLSINYFSISVQVWWVTFIVDTLNFLLKFISTEKCLVCVVDRWRHLLAHTNNFSLIFFFGIGQAHFVMEKEKEEVAENVAFSVLRFAFKILSLRAGQQFFQFIYIWFLVVILKIFGVFPSPSLVLGWVGWLHRYFAYTHTDAYKYVFSFLFVSEKCHLYTGFRL